VKKRKDRKRLEEIGRRVLWLVFLV